MMTMQSPFSVPILLVTFNRPAETRKLLDLLSVLRPSQLFIASDGPRIGRNDSDLIQTIRAWAFADPPFFQATSTRISTLYQPTNLGCKQAYNSALSWFFSHVDEGIILEDDTLVDPAFFPYAEELLERYRYDTRVGSISAYTHILGPSTTSYRFSRFPHVWGFATWRRVFDLYTHNLEDVPFYELKYVTSTLGHKDQANRWLELFRTTASGQTDTWCHAWVYTHLSNSLLCVIPNMQLVTNIGFGSQATHTLTQQQHYFPDQTPDTKLTHPHSVYSLQHYDNITFRKVFQRHLLSELLSSISIRFLKLFTILSSPYRSILSMIRR